MNMFIRSHAAFKITADEAKAILRKASASPGTALKGAPYPS
jgi:hypothetical protein